MSVAALRTPTRVVFGPGVADQLAVIVASRWAQVFAVCDPWLERSAIVQQLLNDMRAAGTQVTVYSDFSPELPLADVIRAGHNARAVKPHAVVTLGGGSAIDLGKLAALQLTNTRRLSEYYGEQQLDEEVVPIVAVPTTAGTGSEVTPVAVLSDSARPLKVGISDVRLTPRFAIVDPRLTVTAPQSVTAHSGADALAHALESLTARPASRTHLPADIPIFAGANRMSAVFALEAASAIKGSFLGVLADGSDLGARSEMAWGSLLAGLAFGTAGTHLGHALQYPVGALTRTPHGLGTGLLLPYVLTACGTHAAPPLRRVGDAWGIRGTDDITAATQVIDQVSELMARAGIPPTLRDIGVQRSDIPDVARSAGSIERLVSNAPIPANRDTLEAILESAYWGDRTIVEGAHHEG
jgi:alcohol dehydrogenase